MFCLFRNSRIINPLNYFVLALSWAPVLYWLYFALIEKSFISNFMEGATLMVDLLLGLPIVLLFGIIIYAMIYWVLKLLIISVAPYMIEKNSDEEDDDTIDPALIKTYGEDYWMEKNLSEKAPRSEAKDEQEKTK